MSRSTTIRRRAVSLALLGSAVAVAAGCNRVNAARVGEASEAAARVYVAPGKYDEFYAFFSGGFDGQVGIYGLPSGRLLKHVPVFSQSAENGWGYSEQTKSMMATSYGFVPWDDAHHPQLSQTAGVPDGRWLFINGNNTPRIARLDLTKFETDEILEIPNSGGNHSSPFLTENSEYVVAGGRFSVPAPQRDVSIEDYKDAFSGMLTFARVDSATGHMAIAFQIRMPAFDYDLSHAGKGPSHGWSFFSSYNSEEANTKLELNASQKDKDYIAAINWKQAEQCVAQGKAVAEPTRYAHNLMGEDGIARTEWGTSVKVLYAGRVPGSGVLPADTQEPARGGRRPHRRVHRGRRQAGHRDPGAQLLQDAEGDRRQGLSPAKTTGSRCSSTRPRSQARCRTRVWGPCTPSSTARATRTPRCSSAPRS